MGRNKMNQTKHFAERDKEVVIRKVIPFESKRVEPHCLLLADVCSCPCSELAGR